MTSLIVISMDTQKVTRYVTYLRHQSGGGRQLPEWNCYSLVVIRICILNRYNNINEEN